MRDVVSPLSLVAPLRAAFAPLASILSPERLRQLLRIQLNVLGDVAAPHVLLGVERVLRLLPLPVRPARVRLPRRGLLFLPPSSLHRGFPRRQVFLHEIGGGVGGVQPLLTGAVAVLLEGSAARVAPPASLPERPPHLRVVLLVHVLLVTRLGHRALLPLNHPTGSVVLHVALRLTQQQTLGRRFGRRRVAVLLQDGRLGHPAQLLLLLLELLVQQLSLRRRRLHVNLLPFLIRVKRVSVEAFEPQRLARLTRHVVALELQRELRGRVVLRRRVLAHRPRLRVVVRRRQVQVAEVLGGVLSNAQVTNSHRRAASRGPHALLHLHESLGVRVRRLGVVVGVRTG